MIDWIKKISDWLDGYRTVLTLAIAQTFNTLVYFNLVHVKFDVQTAVNTALLAIAAWFRLIAKKPGPFA